jgi:hypothetical protein
MMCSCATVFRPAVQTRPSVRWAPEVRYARLLVEALELSQVPRPLTAVLDSIR